MSRAWWKREKSEEQTSGAVREPSPLLPDLKSRLDGLVDNADPMDAVFTEAQEQARAAAVRNFKQSGPELLDTATPYLWEYYKATVDEFTQEQRQQYGIPLLPADTDIWTQVTITNAPAIEIGQATIEPGDAYISFEGEVTWEPEHGLQLVIEDGRRVCKVGPYDGHLTNGRGEVFAR